MAHVIAFKIIGCREDVDSVLAVSLYTVWLTERNSTSSERSSTAISNVVGVIKSGTVESRKGRQPGKPRGGHIASTLRLFSLRFCLHLFSASVSLSISASIVVSVSAFFLSVCVLVFTVFVTQAQERVGQCADRVIGVQVQQ